MKIELPDKVAEQLRVNGTDKVKIELRNHDAVITTEASEMSLFQRISLWWYLAPAIISAIVFNVFFATKNQNQIPLSGNTSLGTTVILGGVVIGTLMFAIFFIRERRNQTNTFSANIYWRNFQVIYRLCDFRLALWRCFWLLGTIFIGATFDG